MRPIVSGANNGKTRMPVVLVRLAIASAVIAYTFGATAVLAFIIDRLPSAGNWTLLAPVGYWLSLAPVAIVAGLRRLQFGLALLGYVALTYVQFIAGELATHSSFTFSGGAESAPWYTPLLFIAIYGGMVSAMNLMPMAILYALAFFIRDRIQR